MVWHELYAAVDTNMGRLRLIQTVGPSQGSVIVLVGSRADELGSVGQDYLQKLWDRAREVRLVCTYVVRSTAGLGCCFCGVLMVVASSL